MALLAGVQLQLPAPAVLRGRELLPGEVFGIAAFDTPDVDEHDRVEVQLAQDAVGAGPGVGARVVEGQQERSRWEIDRLVLDEVDERLQVDRLVAGMLDLRHLLGEVLGADAVGGVRGI